MKPVLNSKPGRLVNAAEKLAERMWQLEEDWLEKHEGWLLEQVLAQSYFNAHSDAEKLEFASEYGKRSNGIKTSCLSKSIRKPTLILIPSLKTTLSHVQRKLLVRSRRTQVPRKLLTRIQWALPSRVERRVRTRAQALSRLNIQPSPTGKLIEPALQLRSTRKKMDNYGNGFQMFDPECGMRLQTDGSTATVDGKQGPSHCRFRHWLFHCFDAPR
jgi:hypothetical protein